MLRQLCIVGILIHLNACVPKPPTQSEPTSTTADSTWPDGLPKYDDDWHIGEGWYGDWPSSFVVERAGIVALGHAVMERNAPYEVECELPVYAHVHPWNAQRVATDGWLFRTATRKIPMVLKKSAKVTAWHQTDGRLLHLDVGDTVVYQRSLGANKFVASVNDKDAVLDTSIFNKIAEFDASVKGAVHQWVNIACEGGNRAWLQFKDVMALPGVSHGDPATQGSAKDLDDSH